MTILERVRRWVWKFIGIADMHDEILTLSNAAVEIRAYLSEQSLGAHYREEDRHGEIIELLTKLEQHFVSQHVGRPTTSIPVYDWEQVQIQELAEMLANPPKEEN